ncbi:KAP family NTPase [Chitinibacter sp. SCUT-21]|uniref:KAP family P-loop NTPase fold protein n=1 Tax=Chitinibacter sp. SCUT-21 TaxID=2970891 RepID=UPI0035A58C1B
MTTDLIDKSKFADWKKTHQWNSCLLNREKYGKFLLTYLIEEKNGYVLNIDSRWGSGKTEMLRRLYVEAMAQHHPCVFVDAWVSDFSNEPLQVVASELLTQLSALNEVAGETFDQVSAAIGKFLKGTAIVAAGFATKKLLDDASMGIEGVKQILEKDPKDYLACITSDFNEQINAINSIKSELAALAESLRVNMQCQLPIFVFIDELDRCRPNYAVELLESIKHFFNVSGFVFVVATDTSQITHAIKVIYGEGFDSETYLRRFFDRIASLPESNVSDYIRTLKPEYSNVLEYFDLYPKDFNYWVTELSLVYELSLRDVDQLLARFFGCLRAKKQEVEEGFPINLVSILVLLIEFSHYKDIYEARNGGAKAPNMEFLSRKKINTESARVLIDDALCCETKIEFKNDFGHPYPKYPDEAHFYRKMSEGRNTSFYTALAKYSAEKNRREIELNTQDYLELVELSASLK